LQLFPRLLSGRKQKITIISIGLNADAPDAAAAEVPEYLGTEHHEIHFTVEERTNGQKTDRHLETYE
jgi:asparagine synthase (glutamine-hydrolysing)